ncbi:hypothetical protein, partial [Erwinia amylovora]|uniref:hypothetical protein n=1 Tax=Erwinia amylovora TaxID=552 RepID=UPI0020BEAFAA
MVILLFFNLDLVFDIIGFPYRPHRRFNLINHIAAGADLREGFLKLFPGFDKICDLIDLYLV